MNRTLDGRWLTTQDLLQIVAENDVMTPEKLSGIKALHHEGLIHSALLRATANVRYQMFSKGLLTLDTRRY